MGVLLHPLRRLLSTAMLTVGRVVLAAPFATECAAGCAAWRAFGPADRNARVDFRLDALLCWLLHLLLAALLSVSVELATPSVGPTDLLLRLLATMLVSDVNGHAKHVVRFACK